MLNSTQKPLIKTSIPALEAHGVELTTLFYKRMLEGNPELKHVFNRAHQLRGEQQRALATAVLAYARAIDEPEKLLPALRHIAIKHATIGIREEQYAIVGRYLLEAIREVLKEAATEELMEAWRAAYGALAEMLARMEQEIYNEATARDGGWSGWRTFECVRRTPESGGAVSFYLRPVDGGRVPSWKPGQFVSLRTFVKSIGLMQPRQYTLSAMPSSAGERCLRITVKRIDAKDGNPPGLVSNELCRDMKPGDRVELSAPTGDFTIDPKESTPLVLIAGGIGITPMAAMIESIAEENPFRAVHFLYSTQNSESCPLLDEVLAALGGMPNSAKAIFFTDPKPEEQLGRDYDCQGRIHAATLRKLLSRTDAEVLICGPLPFMRAMADALAQIGLKPEKIRMEVFSTGSFTL